MRLGVPLELRQVAAKVWRENVAPANKRRQSRKLQLQGPMARGPICGLTFPRSKEEEEEEEAITGPVNSFFITDVSKNFTRAGMRTRDLLDFRLFSHTLLLSHSGSPSGRLLCFIGFFKNKARLQFLQSCHYNT
jgi:hypothetical protein